MKYLIRHLSSVGSTNNYIQAKLNRSEPEEGFVLWADEQTEGKGHLGSQWESEKGKNLTVSILLRPFFIKPADQFIITQMISLAIRNLVARIIADKQVKIKWPNDIYVDNSKIAGILIQNTLKGDIIDASVIGIGLNINQLDFQSDAPNPASIKHFTGTDLNIEEILMKLLDEIKNMYDLLKSPFKQENLCKRYEDHMFRNKEKCRFREGKIEIKGVILGVGEYGRLKLKLDNGKIREYDFKEVELIL